MTTPHFSSVRTLSILLSCLCLLGASRAAAAKPKKIDAVGWSGSALLLPYHIGVLSELVKRHSSNKAVYKPGKTLTAGTSGGGFIAMATTSTHWSKLYYEVHRNIHDRVEEQKACLVNNPTYNAENCSMALMGTGYASQKASINNLLSNSSKGLAKINGRVTLAITQLFGNFTEPYPSIPGVFPGDKCSQLDNSTLYVSKFNGRQDMLNGMMASSFYSGIVTSHNCSYSWRNMTVRDGGWSDNLPCPAGKNATCLRVSAHYDLYTDGTCQDTSLPPPARFMADIYPGKSGNPLPKLMKGCLWDAASINATTILDSWFEIFDLAKADALAWLKENGHA
eukprot:gene9145-16269_t